MLKQDLDFAKYKCFKGKKKSSLTELCITMAIALKVPASTLCPSWASRRFITFILSLWQFINELNTSKTN